MKHIVHLKGLFFLFLSLFVLNTYAEEWRCIYTLDFGGNDASDPQFRGTPLTADEGTSAVGFKPMISQGNKYTIGKYNDKSISGSNSNWQNLEGDHTHSDDKNRGYFLMLDCPQGCGGTTGVTCASNFLDYTQSSIYEKTLSDNLCTGVTFKFQVFVANMGLVDASSAGSFITLGIYDDNGVKLWEREGLAIPLGTPGTESLDWHEVSGEFSIPSTANTSSIHFRVYPLSAGKPNAETGGYDFGLDDISIYVQQPSLTFNHTDYLYNLPTTLSASLDNTKFFSDMSDVKYRWEYSATGSAPWSDLGTYSYSNHPDFAYTIQKFDKAKNNGYYRLTVATTSVMNTISESSVCCVRDTMRINETKNKVKLVLCEGGSETIDGQKFTDADEKTTKTTTNDFDVTTSVLHKTEKVDLSTICIGAPGPDNITYDKATIDKLIGNGTMSADSVVNLSVTTIPTVRTNYEGVTCDSIIITKKLKVTSGIYLSNPVEKLCQHKASGFNNLVYDKVGIFKDTADEGCIHRIQEIVVSAVYDTTLEETICENTAYEGKNYPKSGDYTLGPNKLKSIAGCDSTVTINLHVTSHTESNLPEVTLCQSDFGEGKTAYSFNGKNYVNSTAKDMVMDLKDTAVSVVNKCDSIINVHVTIHPLIHAYKDTLICRDQILFGTEYNAAGNFTKDFHYTSAAGCDSLLTWKINVLDIQLKLRAEFGASDICEGQSATLIVDLIPSNVPLHWEPELTSRNPLRPSVMPTTTTTYVAHAVNSVGCHATDSITISVHPTPTLTIDSIYQQDRKLDFTVTGGTPEYSYMVGTKTVTPVNGSSLEGLTYGSHELKVIDSVGCTAVDTFVLEPVSITPSAVMTPNGDGINDTWIIKNIDTYPLATVRIYDRYGKLLFEKTGYDNSFDGMYEGKKLPSTDYWYEIDMEELDKQYIGHFTLIR